MKKRLLSILLTACLLVGLLPTVALAEDPATQTQMADFTASDNGVAALALLNAAKTTGAEDSTWDSDNKILTLKGVNFTTSAPTAVKLPDGAKIVLADGTANTITGESIASDDRYGIYAKGDLTIEGTGELTVTGGATNYKHSYGIYATVDEPGQDRGNVTISGGTVHAKGGPVTTTVQKNYFGCSCGIYAYDSVTISGGIVHAEGDKVTTSNLYDRGYSYGIYVYKSVTISGGSVDAEGGDTGETNDNQSYGIYARKEWASSTDGEVKISGGTVTATGGTAKDSGGIYAYKSLTISGGSVDAKGGAAYYASYGIYAFGAGYWNEHVEVKISGGTVTATGGKVTTTTPTEHGRSCGIYASLISMSITGGHVTAQTLAETDTTKSALNREPNLDSYDYFWRISPEAQFTDSSETQYGYDKDQTYVEFSNGYNVTLNTNDGTINSGNVTRYIFGLGATLPTDVTKAGYTFAGWYDNENFTGNPVTKITETDFGDKTFYAAWRAIPVIPTYPPMIKATEGGTVTVSPKYPIQGSKVTITATPDEGYEVDDVTVTDRNGNPVDLTDNGDGTFTFKQPYGKVTITVTFKETEVEPETDPVKDCLKDGTCPASKFTDVKMDWTHDGIHYCVANGLMNGTSDTTFEPDSNLSRAMLMTILARLDGVDTTGGENWYEKGLAWAVANGISDGTNGDANITREQIVTMLYRYAVYKGYDVSVGEDTNILSFVDAEEISSWAKDAMQWAVGAGLINGKGENNLDPTGKATRAEMAAILYRFCENVAE